LKFRQLSKVTVIYLVMLLMSCGQQYQVADRNMQVEAKQDTNETVQPDISCKLNIAAKQKRVNGVLIDFLLTNHSDNDFSVLTWYTPLEGFYSNLFIITDQFGEPIAYQGPMVKRLGPSAANYQLLSANSTVSTALDLTLVYDLQPGDYKLQLNKQVLRVIENDLPMRLYPCQTDILTFQVN
tara:strand:+ start:484 stop:1029 length:546 start_codon:yes stop_codon:yes gene_type:complete